MKYFVYLKRFLRATHGYPRNFFYRNLRLKALKWKYHYAFNVSETEIDIHNEHKYLHDN